MRASLPLSAAVVAAFAAFPAPAVAADCSGSPPDAEIVCLINEQRSAAGLESLALAPGVSVVASQYAQGMAVEGFFAHVSPEGRTVADRLAEAGDHAEFVAEVIYSGAGPLATSQAAVDGWMASPAHRAALLDPVYTRIGVGRAAGGAHGLEPGGGAIYVADLDSGLPVAGAVEPSSSPPAAAAGDPQAGAPLGPTALRYRPALTARRAVEYWMEAARTGDGTRFCGLEDNRFLRTQFGVDATAGLAACAAGFRPRPEVPPTRALTFKKARAGTIAGALIVSAPGLCRKLVLRDFGGHWKVDRTYVLAGR